ncbi:MAG: type VII toxin-antitoxin system HepT family RNase toxin [Pseudonocardiaceae bacterium]
MTPRTLDWRTLRAKLRHIRELLDDLRGLGEFDVERLHTDRTATLAAERILTLVVDLAFAVNSHVAVAVLEQAPETYADSFTLAAEAKMIDRGLAEALRPSAGARNVLVHNYLEVDYRMVAVAIPLAIEQYGEYVHQVARWLQERAE